MTPLNKFFAGVSINLGFLDISDWYQRHLGKMLWPVLLSPAKIVHRCCFKNLSQVSLSPMIMVLRQNVASHNVYVT